MNYTYNLEAITPVFSYGSNQTVPEIRPASIRGILHQWFRILGYDFAMERNIFGGVSLKENLFPPQVAKERAGKLVVRVSDVNGRVGTEATLPHKKGGFAAPKPCFLPGTTFALHLSDRLGGLSKQEWQQVINAVNAWLLCGGFGTRSTRGGGALQTLEPVFPQSVPDWQLAMDRLLSNTSSRSVVLPNGYPNEREARTVVTDTIGGYGDDMSNDSLSRIRSPLGFAKNRDRKTSPLKLTVRYLDDAYRIIAFWDGRVSLTDNSPQDLQAVVRLLRQKNKPIGTELETSILRLVR